MNTNSWIPVAACLPREQRDVETKVDNAKGCRNIATLQSQKNLWWLPDGSMYVYYTPTHWRELE